MSRQLNLTIDLYKENVVPIKLKQDDTTILNFTVTEHGVLKDLTGCNFELRLKKPDNTLVTQTSNINLSNGIVSIELIEDCLRVAGESKAELRILKDNVVISTYVFTVIIGSSLANITPSNNVATLVNQLNEAISTGLVTKQQLDAWVDAHSDIVELDNRVQENTSQLADSSKNINRLKYKTVSTTITATYIPDTSTLNHLQTQGADVVLIPMVYTDSYTSYNFSMVEDSRINQTINNIKSRNLKVQMLKPHIGTIAEGDGFGRGNYIPSDYSTFFINWKNVLLHCAQICNDNGIPILCISCEQYDNTLSLHSVQWQDIYNTLKNKYPNLLITVALSTKEWLRSDLDICNYVDIIGLNVYLQYTTKEYNGSNITNADISKGFFSTAVAKTIKKIVDLNNKYRKPIFITEIGIMPKVDALIRVVSNYLSDDTKTNYDIQGIFYKSVFDTLCNCIQVIGVSIWHTYSPFKYFKDDVITAGEQVIIDYFKGGKL